MIKKIIIGGICLMIVSSLFVLVFKNIEEPISTVYVREGNGYETNMFLNLKSHLKEDSLYIQKVGKENPFK